jgi:hypothetical protein
LSTTINIISLKTDKAQKLFHNNDTPRFINILRSDIMRSNIFIIPAIAAMASAHPTEGPAGGDLFVRDEYRWCLGTRPRDLPTLEVCN